MNATEFNGDKILMDFLADYIDGNLDKTERKVFESWLEQNKPEREFVRKVISGKQALSVLAKSVNAGYNFEARLALQIALYKNSESQRMETSEEI